MILKINASAAPSREAVPTSRTPLRLCPVPGLPPRDPAMLLAFVKARFRYLTVMSTMRGKVSKQHETELNSSLEEKLKVYPHRHVGDYGDPRLPYLRS